MRNQFWTSLLLLAAISVNASWAQSPADGESAARYEILDEAPTSSAPIFWIKAGPGFATISSSDPGMNTIEMGSRTGIHGGIGFDLPLGTSTSIDLGLNFIQRGYAVEINSSEDLGGNTFQVIASSKINVSYLVIPAVFKIKTGDPGNTRFTVGAGPYAGYQLSVSGTSKGSYILNGVEQSFDQSGSVENEDGKKFDFGLRGTLGVEMPMGSSTLLSIGGDYDFGLANIASDGESAKTRTLLATVALGFLL